MRSLMSSARDAAVEVEVDAEAPPPMMSTLMTEAPLTPPPDSDSSR